VDHYNNVRLNSATSYITPKDMLAGLQEEIHTERDRKLVAARKQRRLVASKALDVRVRCLCCWHLVQCDLSWLKTSPALGSRPAGVPTKLYN